jgi:pilus assembly protein CpaF
VMCTIHSPSAHGVFDKVLINALKANPAPSTELVMRSLAALDLVVHVARDQSYHRFVSGIYELGPVGDSGAPTLAPIFVPRADDGRAVPTGPGLLSDSLRGRLEAVGFDPGWLNPAASDWPVEQRRGERAS